MADSKITALTALTAADPVNDMFPVVDVSDTSMAASGTTKRISINNILACSPSATLASVTITGAATVGTTLGVTGASTLASVGVTGAATVGTTLLVGTNATLTNGNVILGTSGKGIDFSATANSSGTMTSELLNDYEEGTWTGTLTGSTTNPTVPVTATGKYTKIGRQVTIVIYFNNVSTVGASGGVGITGLPFTEDGNRAIGTAGFYNFDFNGGTAVFVDVYGTSLFLTSQLTNSNWRDVNHSAGVGRYLRATVTYFV